ncbi:hypothetical protein CPB86DRAFT_791653 [Serendipita vermifera]|nr:hypothetical protein CPB86DRAFT_791653 [Serendipita vermifera]
MTSYNLHYGDHSGHGHWRDGSLSQYYANDTTNGINTVYSAHPEISINLAPLPTTAPPIPPPYPRSVLSHLSSRTPPSLVPYLLLNDPGPHSPLMPLNFPFHNQPGHLASLFVSAPTNDPPMIPLATPNIVPVSSTSQRAKFSCPSCGKIFTSRPRAHTCLLNHTGAKPFACNGACGLANW